ncbi:protein DYAD-like [Pistacia vera]|uniref:protein DYAD-like n=1 Tax=Pistacia vera TaxID=55513 RepID=UPI0012638378|nr:protein DYAD-like [Pistacia vera]
MASLDEKEAAHELSLPPVEILANKNVSLEPSKNGHCLTELNSSGMLNWGNRKKFLFLRNNETEKLDGEEEDVKLDRSPEEMKENRKRKRAAHVFITSCEKKTMMKNKGTKNFSSRWSKERYQIAELNMLKILKEKEAVFGKPILRPALRLEARKLIGDTGLLDHLLKHMAGKVAPGGRERFRRRHNADGAMEYWLESADLVNIRKEAGVEDPYWIPPPGWSLGDNPIQDPVCAMEFKLLKEAMAKMERNMQEFLLKKQEDDVAVVNTPSSCNTSQNFDHENFLLPLKEMYTDLVNKKAKIEGQMVEVSRSLCGMEVLMEKLKSSVEETNRSKSTPAPLLQMGSTISLAATTKVIMPEDKAAKIKRLKSSFKICKPQGSFMWPDMTISVKDVVPLEDLIMVPTPPSVSSSSTSPPHFLLSPDLPQMENHSTSLVKPRPERRPLAVTLSDYSLPPETTTTQTQFVKNTTTAVTINTNTKTSLINLNVVPNKQNETITTAVSFLQPEKQEDATRQTVGGERKEILMECGQKRRGCSSTSSSSPWLALATPNPLLHKWG